MDKFIEVEKNFYNILNSPKIDTKKLGSLFVSVIEEYKIKLLHSYFNKITKPISEKLKIKNNTLEAIKEVNRNLKLYEEYQ